MSMQSRSRGLRGLCRLLGYSPQAYYSYQRTSLKRRLGEDLLLGQVLAHRRLQPRLGGRKLHEMLLPFMAGHDLYMGRDQLFDLLRENDLLIKKRRRSQPRTTDSNHWMKRYPDLAIKLKLNRADQLWVSDITYIRLTANRFGYLSLVTDAYSRKIVGFHISDNLQAEGPVAALQMALGSRSGTAPLIHHSDRGSQYCCSDYVEILQKNNISISMTQSGDPRDNAIAERVNGILKNELLDAVYSDAATAGVGVAKSVNIYNYVRPHSSLDMLTPAIAHSKAKHLKHLWKSPYQRRLAREATMDG